MPQSQFGRTRVFDDFLGPDNDLTWGSGTVKVGNFGFVSVNEGSFEWTVDEPGGIVAVTTDTGDNDNAALFAGTFQPSLGGCVMEARFKFSNVDCAIYAGFTETLALGTPVMPAEFATATMAYNGSGGMVGVNYDVDGTTDDFRSVFGDAGAISGGATAGGTRASETITADEWYIVRVEIDPDGTGRVYVGHDGGLSGGMDLIEEVSTAAVTNTDQQHAVLMIENRSGNARALEVDYLYAEGGRDWSVD